VFQKKIALVIYLEDGSLHENSYEYRAIFIHHNSLLSTTLTNFPLLGYRGALISYYYVEYPYVLSWLIPKYPGIFRDSAMKYVVATLFLITVRILQFNITY
jgi:hypothetical protein